MKSLAICLLLLSGHVLAQPVDHSKVLTPSELKRLDDADKVIESDDAWFKRQHAARPSDRAVRILAGGAYVTGSQVPADKITTILFTSEACSLNLENKRGMYRAWMAFGAYQLGCWYPTVDDGYVFVGQIASLTNVQPAPGAEVLPRAMLHADGSATITEPDYDSRTFLSQLLAKRQTHMLDHAHDKP